MINPINLNEQLYIMADKIEIKDPILAGKIRNIGKIVLSLPPETIAFNLKQFITEHPSLHKNYCSILKNFNEFMDSKGNVILQVSNEKQGGKENTISRALLEVESTTYQEMFEDQMLIDDEVPVLPIFGDVSDEIKDIFCHCLQNVSSDSLNADNCEKILELAHQLGVEWLERDCVSFMIKNITFQQLLPLLNSAATGPSQLLLQEEMKILINYLSSKIANTLNYPERTFNISDKQKSELIAFSQKFNYGFLRVMLNPNTTMKFEDGLLKIFVSNITPEKVALMVQSGTKEQNRIYIDLQTNDWTTPEHIKAALKDNKTVKKIRLLPLGGDIQIRELQNSLKGNNTLENLEIWFECDKVTEASSQAIAEFFNSDTLKNLTIMGTTNLAQRGTGSLLSRDQQLIKLISENLAQNKQLKDLTLMNHSINVLGAENLAKALEKNSSLLYLDLSCNNIEDEGAFALVRALERNKTILSINICDNNLTQETIKKIKDIPRLKVQTQFD